jgi:ketosteroid isomerase-like protein
MKRSLRPFLAITLLALAAAPWGRAQDSSAGATETKLKEMEDSWEKALVAKDYTVIGNLLADDYAGINSKGKHQNKSELIDEMKADTVSSAVNDRMDVHVYAANLATVSGTSTEKGKDKDGKAFSRSYAWVDTWMERNGKWECIAEAAMLLHEKK